jgi:hypothetical protein
MQVTNKILQAERLKNFELKKYELYAIMTILIKEKNHFNDLNELNKFLDNIIIPFSKMERTSRKLVLLKAIETIEKFSIEEMNFLLGNIKNEIEKLPIEKKEITIQKKRKNNEEGYINSLLEKFSRN